MNINLLMRAPAPILIHLATVFPALALGTWLIFFSRKGAPYHRLLGRIYLALMLVTAVAVCFIQPLSFLHIFVPVTFFSAFGAFWYVRRGNIVGHRAAMLGLYFGGLILAGGLALFLPGRLMFRVLFG